jgi:hypothetical protein
MSDEPQHRTSRAGVIFVVLAVGGSAIGVVGWHLMSNRGGGLDTSGFDMSTNPDPSKSQAPPFFSSPAPSVNIAPAPSPQTSLGMVHGDAGMSVVGPGASTPKPAAAGGAKPGTPKEEAALSFKEASAKHERVVDAFIRRMQGQHPSIAKYGKEWAASPELSALRDQYWKDKDPMKFAYGLAKSKDFGKLVSKYATDPGIRDTLIQGMKEAPPGLMAAVGGLFQNDNVVKDLMTTVIKAVGLPPSLTGMITGGGAVAPDQSQIMADIMKSAKTAPPPAVTLPDKDKEPAPNNGFTPLGSRR